LAVRTGVINATVEARAGTAVAPADYTTPNQNSVFFGDGDTTPKLYAFPIIDDFDPLEITEQFSVDLVETISPGQTQVIQTAVVTIEDNDSSTGLGTLGFDPLSITLMKVLARLRLIWYSLVAILPTTFDFHG
jgi:hypothetical protein